MNEVKGKCGKQILHVILSSSRLTIHVSINNFSFSFISKYCTVRIMVLAEHEYTTEHTVAVREIYTANKKGKL